MCRRHNFPFSNDAITPAKVPLANCSDMEFLYIYTSKEIVYSYEEGSKPCSEPSDTYKCVSTKLYVLKLTSICRLVFATSSGQVIAAARTPATNPAEKFTPTTLAALASSPNRPKSFRLICKYGK